MSRAVKDGWDFIEAGKIYQYKEDSLIAMVEVLENNSNEEEYSFKLKVLAASYKLDPKDMIFEVFHNKAYQGIYSGMSQFYSEPAYFCKYKSGEKAEEYNNEIDKIMSKVKDNKNGR